MRLFLSIGLVLLINGALYAQSLFYSAYGENQGLDNAGINVLVQDEHGYLWVGTDNGLFRFDGYSFTEVIFSDINTDKMVLDLAVDQEHMLWIASTSGLTSFDGSRFNFLGLSREKSNHSGTPKILLEGKEVYFADSQGKIFRINQKKLQKISDHFFITNDRIVDWRPSENDSSWILTESGKLYFFSRGVITGPMKGGPESGNTISRYLGLHAVTGKSMEVITDKGVFEVLTDLREEKITARWLYKYENIDSYYSDSGNNHWIAGDGSLRRISKDDTLTIKIKIESGSKVLFFEDAEKNIWLAASGTELYKFTGDLITRLEEVVPANYTPTSFLANGNDIWISYFGAGVKIYDMNNGILKREVQGLISNYVRDIILYRNEKWFITARGVSRMKNTGMVHYSVLNGLPHNYCYKGGIDDSGNLLVATEQGLAVFENEKFVKLPIEGNLEASRVKDLVQTKDGSVLVVRENAVDRYSAGRIKPFIQNGFAKKDVLNTVAEDQFGNYWIGSDMNGLFSFTPGTATLKQVSREWPLPFSRVRALVPYGEHFLCIGTEKGIMYAEINAQGEITRFYPCGLEMGYPDFEVNQHAAITHGNKIYFGTSMGTILFQPEKLNPRESGPVVNITGFDISFKETDWSGTSHQLDPWFRIPERPVLNHEQNDLLFHFAGISLFSTDLLWYRYQLENYDDTWSPPSKSGSAIYANLAPGNYVFRVKASYDGFNWYDPSTSYALIIAPPFWKTWWFYAIAVSFVLAGFIMFNNYRIKIKINQLIAIEKLKKEEFSRIQKKVAMDFHDEVGNHLTSISLLVELIKSNEWKIDKELRELLDKIDDESKNLFRGTRDFIWSIDPANDNLMAVYQNIHDYAIDLFENSSISFHPDNGKADMFKVKLPAGFTRHIVLIFKEGLNNVLNHAGCRNVYFSISVYEKNIELKLRDDGKGFCEKDLHQIEGIKKMKYRGAKIKSELILNSDESMGTEIILKARV